MIYTDYLIFPSSGATKTVQVDYTSNQVINTPEVIGTTSDTSEEGITVTEKQRGTTSDGTVQIQWAIEVSSSSVGRKVRIVFNSEECTISQIVEDFYVEFDCNFTCQCNHSFPDNIIYGQRLNTSTGGFYEDSVTSFSYMAANRYRLYFATSASTGFGLITGGDHGLEADNVYFSDGITDVNGFTYLNDNNVYVTILKSGANVNINKAQVLRNCLRSEIGRVDGGEELQTIGMNCFSGSTTLTSITFYDKLTTIENGAFDGCSGLTEITIPESVVTIGDWAFNGCSNITSDITIPSSVTSIGAYAFNGCSGITSIELAEPSTSVYLRSGCFSGTNIKSITIPQNVVGSSSYHSQFKSCDSLETVFYNTWYVNYQMFAGCDKLERFVCTKCPELLTGETVYNGYSYVSTLSYFDVSSYDDIVLNPFFNEQTWPADGVLQVKLYYTDDTIADCVDDFSTSLPYAASEGNKFVEVGGLYTDDATITANPASLTFPYSGGTAEVEFTVNEPDENGVDVSTTSDYVTIIQQTSEVDNGDGTVTYTFLLGGDNENESTSVLTELVTVTYTNVSGQQATMEYPISFEVNPALQAEAYITLDSYAYTFPSSGGTVYVRATYGYPSQDEGISCRVVSGTVYPIAWCTATSRGGSITDDGSEGYEDWAITMTANEIGESRQCSCNFSYTNSYGESAGVTFTALQEYDEEEETPTAGITPYVSILKLDSDGLNKLQSNDYVTVAYTLIESFDEPSVNVDWFRITSSATTTTVSASTEAVKWYFQCDANTSDEARTATITFTGTDSAATYYSATVAVEQDGADGSTVQPTASITVTPKVLTFDKSGGTKTVTVTYTEAEFINSPDAVADWCTVEFAESNLPQVTYNVTVPATTVARQTNAIFKCQGYDEKTVTNEELYIMQEYDASDTPTGSTEIYIGQIWKDVEYSFGNAQIANYTIYDEDNKLLFAGRSVLRPDDETNKILVNKVCQNYMESPELNFDYATVTKGYKAFTLRTEDGGTILHTYKFINDWSYDTYYTGLVSHPILDKPYIVDGQKCPFTVFAADTQVTVPYGVTYKNGSTYNNYAYVTDAMVTEMFDRVNDYPMASVHIGNKLYEAKDKCKAQYVLYYLNPWGGYDWFPIAGRVTQYDDITQYTFTKNYLNTTLQFGRSRYLSEIEKHYILNTEWLNDDESARMWYLLESNTVYLHNLKDDKIYPVIITDTRIEHKKRTIGSSRISYQIDVMLSQMRHRY